MCCLNRLQHMCFHPPEWDALANPLHKRAVYAQGPRDTIIASMANCARWKTVDNCKKSKSLTVTRLPASWQTRAAADSNANPPRLFSPTVEHAARQGCQGNGHTGKCRCVGARRGQESKKEHTEHLRVEASVASPANGPPWVRRRRGQQERNEATQSCL